MSKFKEYANKEVADIEKYSDTKVTNFMGGNSYSLTPINTLRIIAASSIFGEPSYYRNSDDKKSFIKNTHQKYSIFSEYFDSLTEATTDSIFTTAIDLALSYDFKATLDLAVSLRKDYFMRFNPSVIFIRAILHKDRIKFSETNSGYMREIGNKIIERPDDITNQFEYFMYLNHKKNGLPSIAKRIWSDKLSTYSKYHIAKYKSKSLIDLVRISHAHSEVIDELMKTGTIATDANEKTWEVLRSQKMSWKEIFNGIKIPHMALLRNLRGMFIEIDDIEFAKIVLTQLKDGVKYGKQFPYRYWSAYNAINSDNNVHHKALILDALDECIDISIANLPKLKGKTICLSDNSGSAWGALTTEYGSTQVAVIDNLSSLITAAASDEGEVGVFGDNLSIKGVSKRNGILTQLQETSSRGRAQGGATENGIWIFFRDAIAKKLHYDNIFIYSDQQAGHGGLYGTYECEIEYRRLGYSYRNSNYIDVMKLIEDYRKKVNPKVNIFSIQTAGYDNAVIPENIYRGAILTGWTGKESIYAKALIDIWDDIDNVKRNGKNIIAAEQKQ